MVSKAKASARSREARKKAERGGKPSLVEKMLDIALETFEPHFKDICQKLAKEAKAEGGSQARFIVEFAARYADRQDEGDARRDLMDLTRRVADGASYMPEGMKEDVDKDAQNGNRELAGEDLLESEEDRRVVQSDLGSAPGSLEPGQGLANGDRPGAAQGPV